MTFVSKYKKGAASLKQHLSLLFLGIDILTRTLEVVYARPNGEQKRSRHCDKREGRIFAEEGNDVDRRRFPYRKNYSVKHGLKKRRHNKDHLQTSQPPFRQKRRKRRIHSYASGKNTPPASKNEFRSFHLPIRHRILYVRNRLP